MDILQTLIQIFTSYGYAAVFLVLLACSSVCRFRRAYGRRRHHFRIGLHTHHVHHRHGRRAGRRCHHVPDRPPCTARGYAGSSSCCKITHAIAFPHGCRAVRARYSNWVLFVARFLPGLRSPIFLTAGMTRRIPFWRFLLLDGLAALISVPVWVYLGYFGAYNRD